MKTCVGSVFIVFFFSYCHLEDVYSHLYLCSTKTLDVICAKHIQRQGFWFWCTPSHFHAHHVVKKDAAVEGKVLVLYCCSVLPSGFELRLVQDYTHSI